MSQIEPSGVLTLTLSPKTPIEKGEYAAKEVVLREADISVIPAHLFTTFRNVTRLNLSRNELEVLPDAIGECVQLRWLFLCRNKLQTLPGSIVKCIRLEQLLLDENELQTLPENIGDLQDLICLKLDTNQLETVPKSLATCERLRYVNARWNRFIEVPYAFIQLRNANNASIIYHPQ